MDFSFFAIKWRLKDSLFRRFQLFLFVFDKFLFEWIAGKMWSSFSYFLSFLSFDGRWSISVKVNWNLTGTGQEGKIFAKLPSAVRPQSALVAFVWDCFVQFLSLFISAMWSFSFLKKFRMFFSYKTNSNAINSKKKQWKNRNHQIN